MLICPSMVFVLPSYCWLAEIATCLKYWKMMLNHISGLMAFVGGHVHTWMIHACIPKFGTPTNALLCNNAQTMNAECRIHPCWSVTTVECCSIGHQTPRKSPVTEPLVITNSSSLENSFAERRIASSDRKPSKAYHTIRGMKDMEVPYADDTLNLVFDNYAISVNWPLCKKKKRESWSCISTNASGCLERDSNVLQNA